MTGRQVLCWVAAGAGGALFVEAMIFLFAR